MDNNIFKTEGERAGAAYKEYTQAFVSAALGGGMSVVFIYQTTAAQAFIEYYKHDLDFERYGIPNDEKADNMKKCAECWCNTCTKKKDCTECAMFDTKHSAPCDLCEFHKINVPLVDRNATICEEYTPE